MAKHYTGQRPLPRGKTNSLRQLFWMCIAFVCGYFFSTVYDVATFERWITETVSSKKQAEHPAVKVEAVAPPPKPKFEFYTLLTKEGANKEVAAKVETQTAGLAVTQNTTESNIDAEKQFTVQLAAFSQRAEAEKMKAQLSLKGFQVSIVVIDQQKLPRYRVILGPFTSREAAEAARHTIAERERISGMIRDASV